MKRSIPFEFIRERKKLSWNEVRVGIEEGWLDLHAPVECALENLSQREATHDEDEIELAGLLKSEESNAVELVKRLASKTPAVDENDLRMTWMRIILAWVYQNRLEVEEPLRIVEELYADFGYPDEIRDLVRYNSPSDGYRPQDHSQEENLARLMNLWREYLDTYIPA